LPEESDDFMNNSRIRISICRWSR